MTSEGMVEMFEGDSAGLPKNFRSCQWGAERRVSCPQPEGKDPHRCEQKYCSRSEVPSDSLGNLVTYLD